MITKATIDMLKIFSKQTDRKAKPEYHNIHFHSDGWAYFPIFPAIVRFKYDAEGLDFADRDSIIINCAEFLKVVGNKGGRYRIGCKDGLAWVETNGTVKQGITAQDRYIKNIGKLFNLREAGRVQWAGEVQHPLAVFKQIPQVLSLWVLTTLVKMYEDFRTLDYWYAADSEKEIVFASTADYECLFVPISIKRV